MANSVQDLTVSALVASIARALVDLPEEVSVISTPGEDGTALRLRVDHTDVGKVIGKQGRTARSIRNLLAGISTKLKHTTISKFLKRSILLRRIGSDRDGHRILHAYTSELHGYF